MISAAKKGVAAFRFAAPPKGEYEEADLANMPGHLSYRAAARLIQAHLQWTLLGLAGAFAVYFLASRMEVRSLRRENRQTEQVLALAVQNLTQGASVSVADQYIESAVTDFLNRLGNFTPAGIEYQYGLLARFMSPQLMTQFQLESKEWIDRVRTEQLSEILTVKSKEIETDGSGHYRIVTLAQIDSFVRNENIGHREEAIEMEVSLLPPTSSSMWRLQITRLKRAGIDAFKGKRSLLGRAPK